MHTITTKMKTRSSNQLMVDCNNNQSRTAKANQRNTIKKRSIQQQAFNDLIKIRNANGGSLNYGDIRKVVLDYQQSGCNEVTTRNMRHRLSILSKIGATILPSETFFASNCIAVDSTETASVSSSLTSSHRESITVNVSVNVTNNDLANHWTLDDAVCEAIKMKVNKDKEKQRILDDKKAAQVDKEQQKFRSSFQRYINNQQLKADDYRTLLRRVKRNDDSPIRSKVGDLMQQWQQRKNRLDDFVLTTPTVDDTIPTVRENIQPPVGIFSESEMTETIGNQNFGVN